MNHARNAVLQAGKPVTGVLDREQSFAISVSAAELLMFSADIAVVPGMLTMSIVQSVRDTAK
jgi:hypothetical protein